MLQTVVKWKGKFISKIKSSWKHKMSRKENGIKHLYLQGRQIFSARVKTNQKCNRKIKELDSHKWKDTTPLKDHKKMN